jgi:hypothetical protein
MRPELEELERYEDEVVRPRHGLKPRQKEPESVAKEFRSRAQKLLLGS